MWTIPEPKYDGVEENHTGRVRVADINKNGGSCEEIKTFGVRSLGR
ncbi:MAG: hypothetical protein KBT12_07865 [Bacteroidales bacterium]|nr:hypothetical protein [Candidatus Physcousia equi]